MSTTWLRPMPTVKSRCRRCGVSDYDYCHGHFIVSPTGVAHYSREYGETACGYDATGPLWWWPA